MLQKDLFKSFDYSTWLSVGVVVVSIVIVGYMVLLLITTRAGQRVSGDASDFGRITLHAPYSNRTFVNEPLAVID